MTQPDVTAFLDLAEELGVQPWIGGGWGVDALLGEQTRRHADLDIFVDARQAPLLVQQMMLRGFERVPRDDTTPWNFALGDQYGREVDLDLLEFDADGTIRYGPDETYPQAMLEGVGAIGERSVRCVTPLWQVRFHTGYAVDVDDWHDVAALCERYGIEIPTEYARFRQ